ncbi:MAG: RluA family pseudouridine synthase [Muribaculaceae bacterium]|nr:RluA family pseudouridine synthase [Muribaculaceae bacterium]
MIKSRHDRRKPFQPDRVSAWQNKGENPEPLLQFVGRLLPDASRNDLKRYLRYGHIMINGTVTTAFDAPVAPGEWVELNFTRPFVVFRHPRLEIVYEDDDIIVVNKGYGLLSVDTDSPKKADTAYSLLRAYVKEVNPANKIFVVHRLDRDTSGLMMFAKTNEAKEAMQHNWNNMVLERTYVAVLEGEMPEKSGVISSNLDQTSRFEVYTTRERGEGKRATTRYRVLKRGRGRTLAEFSLDTGRKNQIRVHARDLGHPITGDRKYGAAQSPIHRLALHARTLRFAHPVTREDMHFKLPIPHNFLKLV